MRNRSKPTRTLSENFHEATRALARLRLREALINAQINTLLPRLEYLEKERNFIRSRIAHWEVEAQDRVNS
jgi:hypothetical protein